MNRSTLSTAIAAVAMGTLGFVGSLQAAPRLCDDGSRPPCRDTGEATPSNNLSYPAIWSDGVSILAPLPETDWTFAPIDDPAAECFAGDTGGLPVPEDAVCYYDGSEPALGHVWWLQQREANRWQAFNPLATQPVAVTGVDWGDDLESRDNFNTRSVIRTEVVLLKNVVFDPTTEFAAADFLAFQMSGAVPGTANSPVEMQGTNYGGPDNPDGTLTLIDPTLVRPGFQATLYSACARLIIQKIVGDPGSLQWSPADGYWGPVSSVNNPVFDGAVYADALPDNYSAEINVGGSLIYGYNWNLRKVGEGAGLYRLTYVLDGGPDVGGPCTTDLNTYFAPAPADPETGAPATEVVNIATNPVAIPAVVPAGDLDLNGDLGGGLSYIDVVINAKTSGGGGQN